MPLIPGIRLVNKCYYIFQKSIYSGTQSGCGCLDRISANTPFHFHWLLRLWSSGLVFWKCSLPGKIRFFSTKKKRNDLAFDVEIPLWVLLIGVAIWTCFSTVWILCVFYAFEMGGSCLVRPEGSEKHSVDWFSLFIVVLEAMGGKNSLFDA